jgi:hypothetical protein
VYHKYIEEKRPRFKAPPPKIKEKELEPVSPSKKDKSPPK